MGAIDDNGSVDRCLFSNSNNNIATFLAFPLPARKKKGAEGNVKCREKPAKKKRKTIAALDYDSNEKDRVYAHSILALASAKGLKEPLVFPLNSNWWYMPVDGTLFLGNRMNVKTIKPVSSVSTELSSIVPGNTPNLYNNKYNCM